MRLLHAKSLELREFGVDSVPDYVILSHTWEASGEVTFQDFKNGTTKSKSGFLKLKGTCEQAFRNEYEWVWIDSCCIDKTSSSELQEAINSMWNWYKGANVCYVYLSDVPDEAAGWGPQFSLSRWFTRGWTTQELIAPSALEFYAADWTPIGTKLERIDEIHRITGISKPVLIWSDPFRANIAQRMSWAAHRSVSRPEDIAYCLLGLFGVHMPMLYGEGALNAFQRLQKEAFNREEDHTIFLWTYCFQGSGHLILASSPSNFCRVVRCVRCPKGVDDASNKSIIQNFSKEFKYSDLQLRFIPQQEEKQFRTRHELIIASRGVYCSFMMQHQGSDKYCALLNVRHRSEAHVGFMLRKRSSGAYQRYGAARLIPSYYLTNAQTRSIFIAHSLPPGLNEKPYTKVVLEVPKNPFQVADWTYFGKCVSRLDATERLHLTVKDRQHSPRFGLYLTLRGLTSTTEDMTFRVCLVFWRENDALRCMIRHCPPHDNMNLHLDDNEYSDRLVVKFASDDGEVWGKVHVGIRRMPANLDSCESSLESLTLRYLLSFSPSFTNLPSQSSSRSSTTIINTTANFDRVLREAEDLESYDRSSFWPETQINEAPWG